MNIFLIILGIGCIPAGILPPIINAPQRPKHGETRIRKWGGDQFWLEEYVAYPSWHMCKYFSTLEEAKAAKAKADRPEPEPVVIEE